MYTLSINMWFQKLMKQFFFGIDQVVYNAISSIYDLLISIARTSILSQADILDMADRIYKLLAIFMIFKVTLSLITYIVNPDDFADKSKGVSKLVTNIVISLGLLILTPYIFSMVYRLQTIILEDNTLATLIFSDEKTENSKNSGDFLNSAGDEIAFITMSAFFTPNISITEFQECINFTIEGGKVNPECSGLDENYNKLTSPPASNPNMKLESTMAALADQYDYSLKDLQNYIAGVENRNLGLMFRTEMAVASVKSTNTDKTVFAIDYKYIFSTVVGVVIVLLLITFCMDVALRSIKLSFLQLIAPIPILSYVDPKSGKDGMFKKWYQLCFKTYISLFIRLLALYFAIYIISRLGSLVDIVDGSSQTNLYIKIFIIIGALMFAKQLPKILEGLGIKLDGDGKFFLNPLKKFEEQAAGGKRITGAAGGMVAGAIGGHGVLGRVSSALTGSLRGAAANKGYSGGLARQAEVNRKLREARINGAGFLGSRAAVLSSRYGLDDADLEKEATNLRKDKRAIELKRREVDQRTKQVEVQKKAVENKIAPKQAVITKQEQVKKSIDSLESYASGLIEKGKAGKISEEYQKRIALHSRLDEMNKQGKTLNSDLVIDGKVVAKSGDAVTDDIVAAANADIGKYLNKTGRKTLMESLLAGTSNANGYANSDEQNNFNVQRDSYKQDVEILKNLVKEYNSQVSDPKEQIDIEVVNDTFDDMHKQSGDINNKISKERDSIKGFQAQIEAYDRQIKNIQTTETVVINGQELSIEEAERQLKEREQVLKDEQDQRKLDRETAKNRKIGGS